MIEQSRQCRKCYLTKPITEFLFLDVNKKWRRNDCKKCRSIEGIKWASKNHDKVVQHRANFQLKVKNGENPHRAQAQKMRSLNSMTIKYISTGRDETFVKHFGCSKKVFMNRFEKIFKENPGMGWHNYGAWHMDHIKPMKEFKLDTEEDRKLCNHYTNLRPVWALVNMQKSSKYEMEQTI